MMLRQWGRVVAIIGAAIFIAFSGAAQRKITPVKTDDKKPRQPVLHHYDKHGNRLETPVRFLTELDTVVKAKSGPTYPLLTNVTVGANFLDAILLAAGQKHASLDVWADMGLWNWLYPTVEAGIGFASNTPAGRNFSYKGLPSFYAKVGFNYNFIYKNKPDYQIYVGFRAGFSDFRFSATDLQAGSTYYDVNEGKPLENVHATSWYGQAVIGIKVKIYKRFSMGWSGRYGFLFKTRTSREGALPWFIPGYGTSPLSATYSLIFTI